MRCTYAFRTERFRDNDYGEWWERYEVTVYQDVSETPDEYKFGDRVAVRAVDSQDYVETWDWRELSTREQEGATAGLIADYERRKAAMEEATCDFCGGPFGGPGRHARCVESEIERETP